LCARAFLKNIDPFNFFPFYLGYFFSFVVCQVAELLSGLDYRRGAVLPMDQLNLLVRAGDEIGRTFAREAPARAAKAAAAARVAGRAADAASTRRAASAAASGAGGTVPVGDAAEGAGAAAAAAGDLAEAAPTVPAPDAGRESVDAPVAVLGADSVLPVFIFALARARVANLGALVQTLAALVAPPHKPAAAGYYSATLQAAYGVLAHLDEAEAAVKADTAAASAASTLTTKN
jgi:hypothetical protein